MTRRCSASSSSRRERARCHDQQPPRVQIPPQHGGESGPCSPYFTTDISSDPRYRCPSWKQPPRVGRSRSNEEKCESSSAEPLGPREREVLKLVVEGTTSKEIAARTGVKPSSIHTYRSRIMNKLEIDNIASLVRFAIRNGLIRP